MATTTDLLTGLAEHLAAAGIGTWSVTGNFTAAQTAITHKIMPATPDRAIVLSPYTVSNDLHGGTTQGLQVRTRMPGRPTDVDDLDDAIYAELHGREDLILGGVPVVLLWRQSHGTLGRDDNNRWQCTANFYALIGKPTAHTR